MSTNARIGFLESGTRRIRSVYHHWDGYPAWLGKTLMQRYPTMKDAQQLVSQRDMSTCWTDKDWSGDPMTPGPLTYQMRGDSVALPLWSSDLREYCQAGLNCGAEYVYVYEARKGWRCWEYVYCDHHELECAWIEVKDLQTNPDYQPDPEPTGADVIRQSLLRSSK